MQELKRQTTKPNEKLTLIQQIMYDDLKIGVGTDYHKLNMIINAIFDNDDDFSGTMQDVDDAMTVISEYERRVFNYTFDDLTLDLTDLE